MVTLYLFLNGNDDLSKGVLIADYTLRDFACVQAAIDFVDERELPKQCHTINLYDEKGKAHWSYDFELERFERDDPEEDCEALDEADLPAILALLQSIPGDQ